MNFQISVHWTALTSVHLFQIRGSESTRKKTQDVDDLRQNLIDARIGVEQSVIDNGIDQWRKRLHTCIRAKEDILYIHCDIDLPKHY